MKSQRKFDFEKIIMDRADHNNNNNILTEYTININLFKLNLN